MDMEDSNGSIEGSGVTRKRLPFSELGCGKDSRTCAEFGQVSVSPDTEPAYPKWTDEKHSLYLKSMETSFVNQLYDSLDMLGWHPRGECASEYTKSEQKHSVTATPSGQFKVFQDGSWNRINFRRERHQMRQTYESDNILSSPWIQHYRSPIKKGSTVCVTNEEGVSFTGSLHKSSSSCVQMEHQDIVESNAEAMDQNFVDEASEEDKQGRKRDNKCRKISKADDFRHDQVVPLNKLPFLGHDQLKE